jgi:hypothetical protein
MTAQHTTSLQTQQEAAHSKLTLQIKLLTSATGC